MSDASALEQAEPWSSRIGVPQSFASTTTDQSVLPGGAAYGPMIEALRMFLDSVAAAVPRQDRLLAIRAGLESWTELLESSAVDETEQAFGHRMDLDGRGQVMAPKFVAGEVTADSVSGHVTFGRFYLGGNGAVHGGAVALFFDEVLGRLCDSAGRPPSRTAYLNVDYLAVTPVGRSLEVRAWVELEERRKRYIHGEIRDGDVVCARAEGLFVSLVAGQA